MTQPITVGCATANGVADEALLCGEFLASLRAQFPDRSFQPETGAPAQGAPRIEFTITQSTPRSLGASVVFVASNGKRTTGTPLQTAFYDRGSDTVTRGRFFVAFLQHNPLPF